jgi:hypothetical protein
MARIMCRSSRFAVIYSVAQIRVDVGWQCTALLRREFRQERQERQEQDENGGADTQIPYQL